MVWMPFDVIPVHSPSLVYWRRRSGVDIPRVIKLKCTVIGFHPIGSLHLLQAVSSHTGIVVHNEREHMLIGLWIVGDKKFHPVCQVREGVCYHILLNDIECLWSSDIIVGDHAGPGMIKVSPSLGVNVQNPPFRGWECGLCLGTTTRRDGE